MTSVANDILHVFNTDPLWTPEETYKPGDVVTANFLDIVSDERFMCRQKPFGDFCSKYNPLSPMGATAWILYDPSKPKKNA